MKPTVENYTVALPWYEREHFEQLWQLANDQKEMPRDYEVWHAAALKVIDEWLARGKALQIVTIRPDEFIAWLAERQLSNTAATRRQYVEERASGIAGVGGVAVNTGNAR
ncbi:hypothetical protein [Bosea sp. MMO-172]|uniref:hypothetical protein n=1 Tax=Bosea sp. MMO-172 TaxID=3127885 RepID=UPI003016DD30